MASVTTTTADKLIAERWADTDINTNEEMVFANRIKDFGTVNKKLHVPLMASIAASTLSAGSGTSLTFTANTETEVQFTPATRYAAVEVEKQATVRAISDIKSNYRTNLELTLAAIIDSDCLSDVASLTQQVNAAGNVGKAEVLDAVQKLAQGAKMLFKPGQTDGIGILHVSQVDDFLSIDNFANAMFRGDGENPIVKGWISRAAGCTWYESGNVYTTGGSAYNPVFIPRAFGIGYNQRTTPEVQTYQLADRIILWADFAHNIVRDAYAVCIVSPAA